jgi:phosphoadenosine phosphosulfate reductase
MQLLQEHIHDELDALQGELATASPQEILRFAADRFGEGLAVVTSFQPTGIVTLHMLQEIAPRTTVITLDTGFLFPQTLQLIDELEARFDLNLRRVHPQLNAAQQALAHGPALWERNPDLCCHLRKVLPLKQALRGHSAWIAGLRRDQSAQRADTPAIEWDDSTQLVKLCPFVNWSSAQVWAWLREHELPYNTLHDQGYPTIGCTHCTHPVLAGASARSGRWQDFNKTECGIHTMHVPSSEGNDIS